MSTIEVHSSRHRKEFPITREELGKKLEKYYVRKKSLLDDVSNIEKLGEEEFEDILESSDRVYKRYANYIRAFYRMFNTINRPLICVRLDNGDFRVLGRALINKEEKAGLELKEIRRNSPLGSIMEGGAAIYQALAREKREKELHELEVQKKEIEIETAKEVLHSEKLRNKKLELEVAEKLHKLAESSDISSINQIPNSFTKSRLEKAYLIEDRNRSELLSRQGLELDEESIQIIDMDV